MTRAGLGGNRTHLSFDPYCATDKIAFNAALSKHMQQQYKQFSSSHCPLAGKRERACNYEYSGEQSLAGL